MVQHEVERQEPPAHNFNGSLPAVVDVGKVQFAVDGLGVSMPATSRLLKVLYRASRLAHFVRGALFPFCGVGPGDVSYTGTLFATPAYAPPSDHQDGSSIPLRIEPSLCLWAEVLEGAQPQT